MLLVQHLVDRASEAKPPFLIRGQGTDTQEITVAVQFPAMQPNDELGFSSFDALFTHRLVDLAFDLVNAG